MYAYCLVKLVSTKHCTTLQLSYWRYLVTLSAQSKIDSVGISVGCPISDLVVMSMCFLKPNMVSISCVFHPRDFVTMPLDEVH